MMRFCGSSIAGVSLRASRGTLVCYDAEAAPPASGPPRTTATVQSLTLVSADGTRFAAYQARPADPSGTGVLVLPDNRGLAGFYEQLTERLAEQGHTALAIDYFGRTAGAAPGDRGADFGRMDRLLPHLHALTRAGLHADFDTAIDHLHVAGEGNCRAVISLGFCLGGRFAYQTSAARFGLAGAIGLYGATGPIGGAPGPTQLAHEFSAPILALFGGADDGIPPSAVAAFDEALTAAAVPHEIVTYPGAPHGFFELDRPEFAGAQEDAWKRILAFLDEHGDRSARP
jgi:dienelactone hydrolase